MIKLQTGDKVVHKGNQWTVVDKVIDGVYKIKLGPRTKNVPVSAIKVLSDK